MANFLQHEPCPRCNSRDNLARYDDGSAWCFGCGYYEQGNRNRAEKAIKRAYKASFTEVATLPPTYLQELAKRGLNASERHLFGYSPELDRLTFRIGDFYEARAFDGRTPKTLSFGSKPFHVLGEGVPIVCVEDIFSAIRVARVTSCISLFGSVIPKPWQILLTKLTPEVIIWLDEDKYREALQQARQLQVLGLKVRVVKTPQDPKNYSEEEVKNLLTTS